MCVFVLCHSCVCYHYANDMHVVAFMYVSYQLRACCVTHVHVITCNNLYVCCVNHRLIVTCTHAVPLACVLCQSHFCCITCVVPFTCVLCHFSSSSSTMRFIHINEYEYTLYMNNYVQYIILLTEYHMYSHFYLSCVRTLQNLNNHISCCATFTCVSFHSNMCVVPFTRVLCASTILSTFTFSLLHEIIVACRIVSLQHSMPLVE